MIGWIIAAGILIGLACLPLGIRGIYDVSGFRAWATVGPFSLSLYPRPKKEKRKKPQPKEEKSQLKDEKPQPSEEKPQPAQEVPKTDTPPEAGKATAGEEQQKGGSVADFMPLVKLAGRLLTDFRRKLRVKELVLNVMLAGEDPCDLAVNYGRACGAVAGLDPQLERAFVIRKKDIRVGCDFTAEKTKIYARIALTITLGRLLVLAVRYGWQGIREYLKITKKRKGGVCS